MNTHTSSNPGLLLHILRFPLVSMLVLYFSLEYVHSSGVIFTVMTAKVGIG